MSPVCASSWSGEGVCVCVPPADGTQGRMGGATTQAGPGAEDPLHWTPAAAQAGEGSVWLSSGLLAVQVSV